MIVQHTGPDGAGEIRLRPNRSLTPLGVVGFLGVLGVTMLAVAGISALQGNVYAPGFALVYLAVVCACFVGVRRRLRREERIALDPDAVTVHRRDGRGEETFRFHPYWVRLEEGEMGLALSSHGKRVEIGGFLGDEERDELAKRLAAALAALRGGR